MTLTATYRTLGLIITLIFCSCKKEENFTSRITLFNAVIDSIPVAFSLKADSILIAGKVGYDSLKANTVVPSGTFSINLSNGVQSLLSFTTNLQANENYTAVVYDSSKRARFFMRKDVLPPTPGFGRCAVRIYTLIPDAAGLYLGNDTARPFISGKNFNDFAAGATSPLFQEIDTISKPYLFRGDSITVLRIARPLRSGKIYSFYLTGSIKDSARLPPKCIIQLHN